MVRVGGGWDELRSYLLKQAQYGPYYLFLFFLLLAFQPASLLFRVAQPILATLTLTLTKPLLVTLSCALHRLLLVPPLSHDSP